MGVITYAALAFLATAVISMAVVAIIIGINKLFSSSEEDPQ